MLSEITKITMTTMKHERFRFAELSIRLEAGELLSSKLGDFSTQSF